MKKILQLLTEFQNKHKRHFFIEIHTDESGSVNHWSDGEIFDFENIDDLIHKLKNFKYNG